MKKLISKVMMVVLLLAVAILATGCDKKESSATPTAVVVDTSRIDYQAKVEVALFGSPLSESENFKKVGEYYVAEEPESNYECIVVVTETGWELNEKEGDVYTNHMTVDVTNDLIIQVVVSNLQTNESQTANFADIDSFQAFCNSI